MELDSLETFLDRVPGHVENEVVAVPVGIWNVRAYRTSIPMDHREIKQVACRPILLSAPFTHTNYREGLGQFHGFIFSSDADLFDRICKPTGILCHHLRERLRDNESQIHSGPVIIDDPDFFLAALGVYPPLAPGIVGAQGYSFAGLRV